MKEAEEILRMTMQPLNYFESHLRKEEMQNLKLEI
jgi:hypothetical protein